MGKVNFHGAVFTKMPAVTKAKDTRVIRVELEIPYSVETMMALAPLQFHDVKGMIEIDDTQQEMDFEDDEDGIEIEDV